MKNLLFAVLILISLTSLSAPYHGKIVSFKQPDGTSVDVKLYGDEYYLRAESLDGYTLIRDENTQWIYYALLSDDGTSLVSSGKVYQGTLEKPSRGPSGLNISRHLDINEKAIHKIIASNKAQLGIPSAIKNKSFQASLPVTGDVKGICVVVDFSDVPGTLPMSEFEDFCNDMNYNHYGNNGSLRTFYHDISGTLLDYQNMVFGYYRAPLTFAEYDAMPYSQGAQMILGQALNWVASQGFDFSTLSTNPDGSIKAINLMYTGYPPNWAEGMWWHMGNFNGFSANGVHSGPYNCSPANEPLELSVVAHENGHMIGQWPDTYKYNGNTGPDGIGSFDLMCWYGSSNNPVPPNPFFKSDAGWMHVTDVTFFNGLVHDTANSFSCYKYRNINDTNEFFIMENRRQEGRSADIPDEGLTIWHIDRMGDNQTWHHQVYLEHANNDITDHSYACFHQGFNTEFSHNTAPNSDLYNQDPSGLRVWEISNPVNIMTYKLGAGQAAPSLYLTYVSISNDNNNNGFPEPGEQADLNLAAANYGQISSANATVSCQATGPNASYINVLTPMVTAGVLGVTQTVPVAVTVTIDSNTPPGSIINLLFTLSDGTYSTTITKHLIIGQLFIMTDGQFSTCNGLFLDPGGILSNYTDNKDYLLTLEAPNAGQYVKVEFQNFDLEEEPNCDYDYLKIYNGPSTAFPLIGKYCGTNSPGTVSSTDQSGALTFEFHSDPAVTGTGWLAMISCTSVTGNNDIDQNTTVSVIPNPTSGISELMLPAGIDATVLIIDITGRVVFQQCSRGQGSMSVDLTAEPDGLYLISINTPEGILHSKILVGK